MNPFKVRLRTTTARIAVGLAIGSFTAGCFFEEEPQPVQTTVVEEAQPIAPPEPIGPKIFYSNDVESFQSEFRKELTKLQAEDPAKANDVLAGMAKIIAYKGISDRDINYTSGTEMLNPFDSIVAGSDDFYFEFHDKVRDKLNNGVTFDSIIKLGDGHERNAVTAHENAIKMVISQIDDKIDIVYKKQSALTSVFGQIGIVQPKIESSNGYNYISMSIINGSEYPLSEIDLEISSNLDGTDDIDVKTSSLDFSKAILPGERRVVSLKRIDIGDVDLGESGKPVIATVYSVTTDEGLDITGEEYKPARKILENMRKKYENALRNVSSDLQDWESKFRTGMDNL